MSKVLPDARAEARAFFRLDPDEMASFVRSGQPLSASLAERVRIVLMLGRPRTCVPNLLAYALGFSYTGASGSLRTVAGALLSCSIGFAANMHNAAIELEEDSRNLPGRVWLIARCGHRNLMLSWRVVICAMLATAIWLGVYFSIFMALAIAGLHQYSAPPVRSKGRPILGLWVFAQTVVFPFLFGWCTEPGLLLENLIAATFGPRWNGAAPSAADAQQSFRYLGMWLFLTLWFMAKGAFKNVPDFAGDLDAGVRTSATVCGTQRRAAVVAGIATVAAYLTLVPLVALGLEPLRAVIALLWLPPVALNCLRLVRAEGGRAANAVLRADMRLSTAFLATLCLLVAPTLASVVMVGAAAALLVTSDALGLDSRREIDVLNPERA